MQVHVLSFFYKIRENISSSPARREVSILACLILFGLFNLTMWLMVPIYFGSVKENVILQYNIYFGISSLGQWPELFYLPLLGLVAGLADFAVAFRIYLENKMLSIFLAIAAAAVNAILLAALSLIIYLNM